MTQQTVVLALQIGLCLTLSTNTTRMVFQTELGVAPMYC